MPIKRLSAKEERQTPEMKNFSLKSKNGKAIKRDSIKKSKAPKKKMKKSKGC